MHVRSAFSFVLIVAFFSAAIPSSAQTPPTGPLDPLVAKAVASVSADRLRAIDTKLVSFGTRSTFSEKSAPGRGVFAARAWIAEQFREIAKASNGRMTVRYDSYLQKADPKERIPRDVEISSVVATLKGDQPDSRTYLMTSHYDSRNSNNDDGMHDAPGADDNGSGTSAVLEAARAMAALPVHATVIFATFDAEEQGLFGSQHLARELKADDVDVEGDLNNDIIGTSIGDKGQHNPTFVRIFSEALASGATPGLTNAIGNENDSPSRELARYAKETSDRYVSDFSGNLIFRADRFLRGGDHESFNAQGFAALRFTEPVETFTHQHQDVRVENGVQYGDLLQYLDFDYLKHVTQYNIASLASLALGPGRPLIANTLTKDLTNDTTLSWSAVPGAVSYDIVRRATTDAIWTHAENVGNVTTVTLPYSKDNWLFGIRAVDAEGHRSVVSFPLPVR